MTHLKKKIIEYIPVTPSFGVLIKMFLMLPDLSLSKVGKICGYFVNVHKIWVNVGCTGWDVRIYLVI